MYLTKTDIKNLLLIVALFSFIPSAYCFTQCTFIGGPPGVCSNDILFTKSGRLISSTWRQGVFLSDDSGSTWRNKNIYPNFGGVFMMTERSNGEIIAVARYGIIGSTDHGETWNMRFERYGLNDYGVIICESPIDSSLFYGMDRQFYKSTDGGRNWVPILNTEDFIDSYTVDDFGIIYIGVRYRPLLRSTNGGISFESFSIGTSLENAIVEEIMPDHYGGLYFKIYQYPDWIVHFASNQLTQIQSGWTNPPLAVTETGDLVYKSDRCIARYNRRTRQSSYLSCPFFVKDQFARRAAIHGNTFVMNFATEGLHRSTDGGVNWTDINAGHGFKQTLSIEITQQGKIFASGFGDAFWGALYKSVDDGITWTRVSPQTIDAYFIDISTLKNGNMIANGSYGVYLADAEGNQWEPKTGISLAYSQYVSKSGLVLAGNDYKGIYISTNNGTSWVPANNGIQHYYFFGFGESCTGRIFASSWPSGTYYSDNNGGSWTYISSGILSYERTFNFTYWKDTVYAATSSGVAYSIDNGNTWNILHGLYSSVNKVAVVPNGDILAAVNQNGVYKYNRDLGWKLLNDSLENINVRDFAFDKHNRLFVATDAGIYRLDDYRDTKLNSLPTSYRLKQNYPNPFNSETTIEFEVPITSVVTIKVYNVLGQQIASLTNKEYSPGHYEIIWDAINHPSGVYFYCLEIDGLIQTRKAILMR